MIGKVKHVSHDQEPAYATCENIGQHIWFEMGIFTLWDDAEMCKVLCVDAPFDLPERLAEALGKRPFPLDFQDPFSMHTDLLDQIIVYNDMSMWRIRDPIRNPEKVSMR
jgi:hypothetical protein